MAADLSTGRIYEASSGSIQSSMSTGDPLLPAAAPGVIPDRYVVSSADGVSWTQPQGLGGGGFSGASGSTVSAANGYLAAAFHVSAGNDAACQFFTNSAATSPCTIFEISTDSGAHWSRYPVPGLANATGSILVAASPVRAQTYSVAATDPTTTQFSVYMTHDSGLHWSGPAVLTDGSSSCPALSVSACKFKSWINYSPSGFLALAWRSANVSTSPAGPVADASIALASSTVAGPEDPPPCDMLGCGVAPPDDENDLDPAPVPYTVWAAFSKDGGSTFTQPLQITQVASAPADPKMLTGTDDTSVVALSSTDVLVGWHSGRPEPTVVCP